MRNDNTQSGFKEFGNYLKNCKKNNPILNIIKEDTGEINPIYYNYIVELLNHIVKLDKARYKFLQKNLRNNRRK